ncbi:DNA polymerase III subunit delta [Reichenbachiella carrageenanivorans]|uniref:DNA polymerase III subunit delta n=1 Tax=Reichenbachiella carrageenanivorans TaxID=2979869 RepID=A0ABY6CZF2_9BACT|nr:DNA polymerase III subunit delta [Reichenbachiella carrageenanivorans]UXX78168.1 DNA polymerase III subunit delta [Reichenbachiella carrageenanivorans]
MAVTYQDILSNLKNNQYAPVYFLQGEESYFIDEVIKYVEQHAMDEGMRSFNQVVIYGKDANIPDIINHAKGFPMMSERKVVIVKEAQEIAGFAKEENEKILISYLENPQPSTVLVFGYKYKTLDKRKKVGKTIDQKAVMMTATKFYDNQIPAWVESFVKSRKRTIDQKALQLIVENIGNNLTRIANEIDKMLINIGDEPKITAEHVYKNIGISKEYNVFELQKALTFKNVMKANEIITYFKSDPKSNPLIPIIANLFSFYNKILLLHHSKDKSDKHLASLLGVHPFFVKEYNMAARNYPLGKVVANIRYLKIADMKSKGIDYPSQPEGEILKELIFNLIH